MKYYIRKTEGVTLKLATQPVELDSTEFEKLSENPYTGTSEDEFVNYIASYDWESAKHELADETVEVLDDLFDGPMEEISNSSDHGGNSRLELGVPDPKYRKNGNFNCTAVSER